MESILYYATVCTLVVYSSCNVLDNNDTIIPATCNVTDATPCSDLGGECLSCTFPECNYGDMVNVECMVKFDEIDCSGNMVRVHCITP